MKVIFLDIDGVLNGGNFLYSKERPDIHPHLAAKLERIVQATSAKIIISSSWRHSLSLVEWNELLTRRGVTTGEVIGTTPKYWELAVNTDGEKQYESAREDEILEWLAANPVENFLVLDDVPMTQLKDNAVETSITTGLTELDVTRAIEILSK